jgi:prepilin-type processing-associated H-X9-DG protein
MGTTSYKACEGSSWPIELLSTSVANANPNWPTSASSQVQSSMGRNDTTALTPANNKTDTTDLRDMCNGLTCRGYRKSASSPFFTTADSDIRDGKGNTFAVGEAVTLYNRYNSWYWFNGATATTGIPLDYVYPDAGKRRDPPTSGTGDQSYWQHRSGFTSMHPGGANFGMCDGSVHFVTDMVDAPTYRYLGTIDGTEVISQSPW